MFGDIVKMGAKIAALVAGAAIIIVLFNVIHIPGLDLSSATLYLNLAYTIALRFIPGFAVLWPIGLAILGLEVALLTAKMGLIAIRWVLKVNE